VINNSALAEAWQRTAATNSHVNRIDIQNFTIRAGIFTLVLVASVWSNLASGFLGQTYQYIFLKTYC
jgi:hypothetical protein